MRANVRAITVIAFMLGHGAAALGPAAGFAQEPMLIIHAQDAQHLQRHVLPDGTVIFTRGAVVSSGADLTEGEINALLPSDDQLAAATVDEELRSLVDQLGQASFEAREGATERLIERPGSCVPLYALLARGDLNAEQRYRLLTIARHRLLEAPRGAVGIQMQMEVLEPGHPAVVRINALIEGLPAEEILHVGDRITHIDGRQLGSSTDLINRVQVRRPGDVITMTIRRPPKDERGREIAHGNGRLPGEELTVEIELGSAEKLLDARTGQPQGVSPEVLRRRMRLADALEDRFGPRPRVVEVALSDRPGDRAPGPSSRAN